MDNFLFKTNILSKNSHIFTLQIIKNTFIKMDSLSWNKLTLQVTLLFQQTNDPTIRLEISEGQISLHKVNKAETTWSTTIRKIGREVINAWDDLYEVPSEILSNENVIRNCWDKIKTSRNSVDVLAKAPHKSSLLAS